MKIITYMCLHTLFDNHPKEVKNKYGKLVEYKVIESQSRNNKIQMVFTKKDGTYSGTDTNTYELIDTKTFDKKISQVLIDGSGQSADSVAILYLMEDGTVESVPILKEFNTNWGQQDNTKKFNSYGKLNGISDIISLVPANATDYHTVLARKADGTIIDLADTFKSTGNFNLR